MDKEQLIERNRELEDELEVAKETILFYQSALHDYAERFALQKIKSRREATLNLGGKPINK